MQFLARGLFIAIWIALTTISGASAQKAVVDADGRPDYSAWEKIAKRAEGSLESGRASTDAFEVLREDLAAWRSAFITRQSANSTRIDTLRGQIAALGAAPAEGETESEEIALRRSELSQLLAQAQVPVFRAEEAFTRAEGLVSEIDLLIRERQTDQTLELVPSPINPANWPVAGRALYGVGEDLTQEFGRNSRSATRVQSLQDNLPLTLLLLIGGLVLVTRSSAWIERGVARLRERSEDIPCLWLWVSFTAFRFDVLAASPVAVGISRTDR